MFSVLKTTVSEKISGIVESLSPSNSESKSTRNRLKRTREEKIKGEHALSSDILVTPPEKRLKQINQDIGLKSSSRLTSFKEFLNLNKLFRNNFLWKYVVQGDKQLELNEDTEEDSDDNRAVNKMEDQCHVPSASRDILLASPSPFQFRKPEEPIVKTLHPTYNKISKRRALHTVREKADSHKLEIERDATKLDSCILSAILPSNIQYEPSSDDLNMQHATYTESIPKKETRDRALHVEDKSNKKQSTVDKVVRLAERDRYRQLLARFTSCQGSTKDARGNNSLQHLTSTSQKHKHNTILDSEEAFPRLRDADSIIKRLEQSISSTESSSSAFSSTKLSSVEHRSARTVASKSLLRQMPRSLQTSTDLKDATRSFSGKNTANISRVKNLPVDDEDLLGNAWTAKWRQILSRDHKDLEVKIDKEEGKLKDLSRKRKERELELLKKVDARMAIDKKKSKEKLVPLTKEMETVGCILKIANALRRGHMSDTLVEAFNMSIKRHDVSTLADSNWLNDEVVNFYFNLLYERSKQPGYLKMHFFNSFFYPKLLRTGYSGVKRWTKKVDIFSVDIVVLPVHLGMHWCLASESESESESDSYLHAFSSCVSASTAIDMRNKQIVYYDSLKGDNVQCISALRNYIMEEHKDKKKSSLNINEWSEILPKNIPEQLNGCDCGVFACKYAECLTRGSELNFTQNDMPYFRRRFIYEIVTKKLL
eukprot:gene3544-4047_t